MTNDEQIKRMTLEWTCAEPSVERFVRRALLLRYEEGLELQQIAERLGKSAGHVGVLLYRVRSALRECIDRRLGAENAADFSSGGG